MESPERRESSLVSRQAKLAVDLNDRGQSCYPPLTTGSFVAQTLSPAAFDDYRTVPHVAPTNFFNLACYAMGGAISTYALTAIPDLAYQAMGGATPSTLANFADLAGSVIASNGTAVAALQGLVPVTSAYANGQNLDFSAGSGTWLHRVESSQDKQVKIVQDVTSAMLDLHAAVKQLTAQLADLSEARRSALAGEADFSTEDPARQARIASAEPHDQQITLWLTALTTLFAAFAALITFLAWLFPRTAGMTPGQIDHVVRGEIQRYYVHH